jgi:hypothetical protein
MFLISGRLLFILMISGFVLKAGNSRFYEQKIAKSFFLALEKNGHKAICSSLYLRHFIF